MTLRHFLDAAYVLLVEEYQRIGTNLMDAIDKTGEFRASSKPEEAETANEAARNEASLRQLEQMMAGVRVSR